ncbi:DUF4401 domain-containing protein [Chitiniphilus eburneus]|uniref:DUF4401 domain-containing protein n=1 Tax=Chitiniphilus eburneus TaxID=2571148 RepID=A0A4U0PBU6_9NEIS|nr:DUF4401 domain-containing protein [Chitiniphilus eburneus]TJZ65010.1 DUF4401 domain-containing protein [Chitiniphilus eburneus]
MTPWPDVLEKLRTSGALAETAETAPPPSLPWPVQALQVVAAWVAAVLVIGAGMVLVGDAESVQIALGVLALVGATAMMRLGRIHFLAQAGVPLALGGAFLIALATDLERHPALACCVIGMVLFWLAGPRLLRVIAAALVLGACWYWLNPRLSGDFFVPRPLADAVLTMVRQLLFGLALWWLWTRPPRWPDIWLPLRDAVLLFWLAALCWQLSGSGWGLTGYDLRRLGLDLLMGLVIQVPLLLAVRDVTRRQPDALRVFAPLLALLPLALLSPLLSTALLVLWLGLAEGRALLIGLGCAAGLAGFSHYYYSLHLPLLLKGMLLTVAGVLLLGAWCWSRRRT